MSQSTDLVATASFSAGKRKLTAAKACAERDADTLIALVNAYLNQKGKRGFKTSAATRKTYETGLLRWIVFCWPDPDPKSSPQVPLLRATVDDIEMFKAARQKAGNKEATVAGYLAAVRTFYKALVWAGAVESSPATEVRSPSDPRPRWERNSPVAMSDYKALIEHCRETKGIVGVRDLAMLRLLGDCGLRIAEAVALNLGDIDLERRTLIVEHGKGDKKRTITLTKNATEALAAWEKKRRPHALRGERGVLINVGRYCPSHAKGKRMTADGARVVLNKLYRSLALPENISGAHALRHTAGTRVYKASNGDMLAVARQLGHEDINTSAIYAHMSLDRMQSIADLMDED